MNNLKEEEVYSTLSESKLGMCDGCLSSDRPLAPAGSLRDLFFRIMSHDDKDGILSVSNLWQSEPQLCWECRKVLLNTHVLQQRVYEAQKSLQLAAPAPGCAILSIQCDSLSTLTGCVKDTVDYHLVNDEKNELILIKNEDYVMMNKFARKEPELYFNNAENDECYVVNEQVQVVNDNDDDLHDNDDVIEIAVDEVAKKANKPKRRRKIMKKQLQTKHINANTSIDRSVYTVIPIDKEEYNAHKIMKKAAPAYMFAEHTCDVCAIVFRKKHNLDKHNKDLHDPNHKFECEVCPAKCCSAKQLRRHKSRHVQYKCNQCDHKSRRLSNLGIHFANKHAKYCKCCDCGMEFTNKSELGEHARARHGGYECDYCQTVFKQKSALASHINQLHKQVKCKICSLISANASAARKHHQRKHEKRTKEPIYCVECDILFDTGQLYMNHVKYHHGVTYECKKCPKTFKLKSLLRVHTNYHHEGKYDFRCAECDKPFTRKSTLDRHILRMHRNIKPELPKIHICEHCSRGFAKSRDLVSHVFTHTGERPHACAQCPSRFTQVTPLVYHLRNVHHVKGETKDILKKNKDARESASGDDSWHRDLVHHVRTHTGERPHACALCSSRFAQESPLVTHLRRIHNMTGEFRDILNNNKKSLAAYGLE